MQKKKKKKKKKKIILIIKIKYSTQMVNQSDRWNFQNFSILNLGGFTFNFAGSRVLK